MLRIPGQLAKDNCDRGAPLSRRDILRVGGSTMLGLTLGQMLELQSVQANEANSGGPGWGKAKSVILVYLQGGPSQLDLWDPKENVPDNIKSAFKPISTKLPGVPFTELLPKLAQVNDKFTLMRSVAYSPVGLLNHTAAIYQIHTGYTTDKVSPSGQLEPPSPKDYPTFGSNVVRLKPPTQPMLPFVMLPRPLQESGVIGKGGTAGFLGRAFDPYYLYPSGNDMDLAKMDHIQVDDLNLRPEVTTARLERRARLRDVITQGMPEIDKAVEKYDLDEYYSKALSLLISGRAREAFNLKAETEATRDRYGRTTFGQSLLLARRLVEAGTRVVEVIWPQYANSPDKYSLDAHKDLSDRLRNQTTPLLDAGLSALFADLDERGLLDETLVLAIGEFGRSPQRGVSTSGNSNTDDGRDHWPYCYTGILGGGGVKRGVVFGKSDATGSAPLEDPIHPTEILASMYHALGISPETIIYNHLNQPREIVQSKAVTKLFA